METAVSHRVQVSVPVATLSAAADSAAAPRDQRAVAEAIAWAVVASAAEDAVAEAVAVVEEVGGDAMLWKKIAKRPGNRRP